MVTIRSFKMRFKGEEVTNVILRKVNHDDYPRYVDASVRCAKYVDGPWLNEAECDALQDQMHADGTMQEMCRDLLQSE
jgi:hypothetical protein